MENSSLGKFSLIEIFYSDEGLAGCIEAVNCKPQLPSDKLMSVLFFTVCAEARRFKENHDLNCKCPALHFANFILDSEKFIKKITDEK